MNHTILLAEDDTNLGYIIKDQLNDEGYDVILAEDGEKAFHFFNNNTISLCIFDIMMPKMDGFSLTKKIRLVNEHTPILFLSAKSITSDRIEGFKAGGDDYLTKPFVMEELLLRVNALLKRTGVNIEHQNSIEYQIGAYIFNVEELTLTLNGKVKTLTKKEGQVLKLLASNLNKLVEREIVLQNIWGKDDYFTGRSLDVFLTKLRKYLSEDKNIQIINLHGVGFKLEVNE